MSADYDVIIIGSGAGGGTLAHQLAPSGKTHPAAGARRLAQARSANWDPTAVFVNNRYISPDTWYDHDGKAFQPQVHYFVGGATKMYGAALYRLRKEDFGEIRSMTAFLRRGRSATTTSSLITRGPTSSLRFSSPWVRGGCCR